MSDDSFRVHPGHHDVFISYAQQDKPIADAVCAKLESRNIRCWIAPRDIPPGRSFPEAIIEGIEDGKVVVLIFSSYANRSPHVTRELTNAVNKGRIIIPFRVEDVPPSKSMEYLISVPHWLDAVTPPMEKHIDLLIRTVESIITPDRKASAVTAAAPVPEIYRTTASSPPVPPVPPAPDAAAEAVLPLPKPEPRPERVRPPGTSPVRYRKDITVAGIVIAGIILFSLGFQTGMFNFIGNPHATEPAQASPVPINYRASDVAVNTVVLTTQPTQTLPPDTELFVDVSKDNSNAMVTVQFNGGPGMDLIKDNQVILTRSDGTITEGRLNFNQRLSEVRLQGTRGTDRLQVIVTLYSGSVKTIVDTLLPYRAYH